MKRGRNVARGVLPCLLIFAVILPMASCVKEVGELEKRADQTLCGVEYRYSSGMERYADVHIQIEEDRVVYASFFPEESVSGNSSGGDISPVVIENVSIDEEKWADIEKTVEDILPALEPVKEKNSLVKRLSEWLKKKYSLDGEDLREFFLTWRDKNGDEIKVQYSIPSDQRFKDVLDLLKETAESASCAEKDNYYRVDYCGSKFCYTNAKDYYRAGEKVELNFDLIATDTDYTFYLDGSTEGLDVQGEGYSFMIRFTMPEHDVKLEYTCVNSMCYVPED